MEIKLPNWAESCGIDGCLMVPEELATIQIVCWLGTKVDWWLASYCYLEGLHERAHESKYGTIHSYSIRLANWDERAWQYAWVNRIALFLRAWANSLSSDTDFEKKIGLMPKTEVTVTLDIDAVKKTTQ